jgi:hypothetical protein
MNRHCKPSLERRRFEQATLKRLAALGVTPAGLKLCQSALIKGRKRPTDDYCDALNRAAQEKAGIELLERCLKGEPPESIIFRIRTVPDETYSG